MVQRALLSASLRERASQIWQRERASLQIQAEKAGVGGAVAVSPPTREGCPRSRFPSASATTQLGQGSSTQLIRPCDGLLVAFFAYLV
jgi:hypothetical protein